MRALRVAWETARALGDLALMVALLVVAIVWSAVEEIVRTRRGEP